MEIKLSAVIITYNEEKNLARCLNSISDVVDEIVIVDSFSKDKTEEIANNYKARFIKNKFLGHIEQKNFAITKANYKHVLSLDADECLSETLRKNIIRTKKNWEYDGYSFNRLTNYCGHWVRYCGWYPDKKLRLWDSTKGSWEGQNPHDEFILKFGAKMGYLKGDLLHYSISSIEDHLKVIDNFSTIAAKEMFKKRIKYPVIRSWIHPIAKFLKQFVIRFGFLDGIIGFKVCYNSAFSTYLKYKKLAIMYDQEH